MAINKSDGDDQRFEIAVFAIAIALSETFEPKSCFSSPPLSSALRAGSVIARRSATFCPKALTTTKRSVESADASSPDRPFKVLSRTARVAANELRLLPPK